MFGQAISRCKQHSWFKKLEVFCGQIRERMGSRVYYYTFEKAKDEFYQLQMKE